MFRVSLSSCGAVVLHRRINISKRIGSEIHLSAVIKYDA